MKQLFIFICILSIASANTFGQGYVKRLKRWEAKGKYEKIARKTNKFAEKYPGDTRVFYYGTLAELEISKKSKNQKRGYKHALKSVRHFDNYRAQVSNIEKPRDLHRELYSEIKRYHEYFSNKNKKSSIKALDIVLASTFRDTTESYRGNFAGNRNTKQDKLPKRGSLQSNDKVRNVIIAEATRHKGKPYKFAAEGPESFDCSGFTLYVLNNAAGVKMPHNSTIQSNLSKEIKQQDAKPGDLIFFGNPNSTKINHTGIVYKAENGEIKGIIHCASRGVVIDDDNTTWTLHWKRRVLKVIDVMEVIEGLK